ncbi:MAG: winged helix-turn-helix transcriptional regulator [Alphaproteobacteria bacterium]|nr:winged helix-turn-helix transcriptional regulator [Alphaproteobacteria bacterium]
MANDGHDERGDRGYDADIRVMEDYITYRVGRLGRMLARDIARTCAEEWELSLPRYRVVTCLSYFPDIAMRELTERTQMDKGQVSRVVTDMEKDGLVERKNDDRDKRRALLSLTAEGLSLARKTRRVAHKHQRELTSLLSKDELAALYDMLERLTVHTRTRLRDDD